MEWKSSNLPLGTSQWLGTLMIKSPPEMESRRCRQWSKRSETMECMVDETAFIYYDTDRVMLISGYAFFILIPF